jgi:predicted ATPase
MARPTRRSGNLPAEASSFIGRRRELAELRKKLAAARLVSLVGPGGVGKTHLAVRIATDLARGFPGGAWMVELAEVRDPALVGNAVMAALGLRDQTATEPLPLLLSYLRDKELLLVVDNCEHLLAAAGRLVTDAVRAAPGVRVIATGREPLSVPGEHVMRSHRSNCLQVTRPSPSPGCGRTRRSCCSRSGRRRHRARSS